jgi:hypothetical protein
MAVGWLRAWTLGVLLLVVAPAFGHIGTSSVFVQGKAGPYPVYVTIAPPGVIPGEAQISVLSDDPALESVSAQANVLAGSSARNMPEGLRLEHAAGSQEFHGTVWIMTQGSWQVRLTASGAEGAGAIAVPLPASPVRLMHMSRPFGALLLVLGLFLVAAVAAIAAAALREAAVEPGAEPGAAEARHGRIAAVVAVVVVVLLLAAGDMLWRQEIARYTQNIYQPLEMTATVAGDKLHLRLRPPSTAQEIFASRRLDDLVLDHNHLMHLYVVRWPQMSVVYHLHPAQVSAGDFDLALPQIAAGEYKLFADIVHADGFPETAVADVRMNVPVGAPLVGDDAYGQLPAFPAASGGEMRLPDGYAFRFAVVSPGGGGVSAVKSNQPVLLRFTMVDPAGNAPKDMQNYMGMIGHAAIIRSDGGVFAHIHPEGSGAMAAMMMANAAAGSGMEMGGSIGNVAAFPFGFPSAGRYRIVVQMKHGETVETGAVDLGVS